jgi:hypothetical protein
MTLQLIDPVHTILELVEERTGRKIEFIEKKDLQVSAELKVAEGDGRVHRLFYRTDHTDEVNYLVAHQCGHVLRLFGAREGRRFIPIANRKTMMSYLLEMDEDLGRLSKVFGPEKVRKLVFLWYEGVVFQVTRMPPDIMVDRWLYDEYPVLRPMQLSSLRRQIRAAVLGLSPDMRKVTPSKVYYASNVMNYVYFKVLEDHFRLDLVAPYHKTVFLFDGQSLVRLTERGYVNTHEGDRAMIDEWARRLQLTAWFEWKHLEG